MSQNLIELELTPEALVAIDGALATLEQHLAGLVALTPRERRTLTKMGDKSEAFCRQAAIAFAENPDVLPGNFDLDAHLRDLAVLDLLRPRTLRVARLQERLRDTETLLGSELMTNSLAGYAVLKIVGKGAGLENLKQMLSARFARTARSTGEPAAPPPAE